MKNIFFQFLKRNYILIILSCVNPFLVSTIQYWGTTVISRDALGPTRIYDLYLVLILPIFYFLYGCVAYIITKKIWLPQLILLIISFVVSLLLNMKAIINVIALSVVSVICSLIGAAVTAFICWIIREIKGTYK